MNAEREQYLYFRWHFTNLFSYLWGNDLRLASICPNAWCLLNQLPISRTLSVLTIQTKKQCLALRLSLGMFDDSIGLDKLELTE